MGWNLRSKKERKWASSCYRKIRYGHARTAEGALVRMAKKGRHGLEVYECSFCKGFHLGHKRKLFSINFRMEAS